LNDSEVVSNEFVSDNDVASEAKLQHICDAAGELKAREITILDVRGQTIVADFFVICTGTSITHIQSIAEGVRDRMREGPRLRAKPEGDAGSYWVIMDYSDVILHIFDEDTREFYELERLWADAKVSHWQDPAAPNTTEESSTRSASSASALPEVEAAL
jgi:ribosome-associated protein